MTGRSPADFGSFTSRTAATVVHMLEPVLNQGYELQGQSRIESGRRRVPMPIRTVFTAIGRVDRLGQERETHVFCYACEGEKS